MMASKKGLLFEAYRRNEQAKKNDKRESAKPITQRWLGLGTAAAYRPVLDAGLMMFHDGRTPPPHCMGWLVLTEAGVIEMQRHEKEFSEQMARLCEWGYERSILANYMLAGGLN